MAAPSRPRRSLPPAINASCFPPASNSTSIRFSIYALTSNSRSIEHVRGDQLVSPALFKLICQLPLLNSVDTIYILAILMI